MHGQTPSLRLNGERALIKTAKPDRDDVVA
jgi:hypothetical protein